MKPEQIELMFPLMVIALLVFASEPNKPKPSQGASFLTEKHLAPDTQSPMTPRQREWAEKAVKRYAEAQEKNWWNRNKAMFEPD